MTEPDREPLDDVRYWFIRPDCREIAALKAIALLCRKGRILEGT
jgi:hypothetical protein